MREPLARFLLYVSVDSLACFRAENVLRALLRQYAVDLQVIDVAKDAASAERERILYTPTLICRNHRGDTRVLGDLSNVSVLLDVLQAMGLEPL